MVKKDDFIHKIEKFENTNLELSLISNEKKLNKSDCNDTDDSKNDVVKVKQKATKILCEILDGDHDGEMDFSDESDVSDLDTSYQERSVNGLPICRGCSKEVVNKYYLRVNETSWHEECLKCTYCSLNLETEQTCFIRKRQILCKIDYYNRLLRHYGIKCSKCNRNIQTSDWVRRAKNNVYHLACFACETCKRQLSTGEEFALQNNQLLCKTHYCESIDGDNGLKEDSSKSKNKRVRTTFTEEQIQILQANFDVDSNPDGQDLERIAQITGLSKRVTQVWFQNSRARQKKYKEKKISMYDNESNDTATWTNDGLCNTTMSGSVRNKHQQHSSNEQNHISNGDLNLSWSSDSPSDANLLGYENDDSIEN